MGDDFAPVSWPEKADPEAPCVYAVEFAAFCGAAIARLDATKRSEMPEALLYLKAELFDRYCDYLTDTPVNHTNAAGKRSHHCVTDVFNDAAREVRRRVRKLPLAARIVPRAGKSAQPPMPEIRGFPLGKREPESGA